MHTLYRKIIEKDGIMTGFNFDKINKDNIVRERDDALCSENNSDTARPTKKPRTRGRNRPRPSSRRYRWKEAIFGRGYPDLRALREGPYRPHQETTGLAGTRPPKR